MDRRSPTKEYKSCSGESFYSLQIVNSMTQKRSGYEEVLTVDDNTDMYRRLS